MGFRAEAGGSFVTDLDLDLTLSRIRAKRQAATTFAYGAAMAALGIFLAVLGTIV